MPPVLSEPLPRRPHQLSNEVRVRKAFAHADRYSQDELDAALVRLAELDASLKGGSRLSGQLELTRALVDLAAGASASART